MITRSETAAQEMQFHTLLENSRVGLLVLDDCLKIVYANQRMFEFFGVSFTQVQGKEIGDVFCCKDFTAVCRACGKENLENCALMRTLEVIREGTVVDNHVIQYIFMREKVPQVKWFQISGCTMYAKDASFISLVFTDITDLKQREERLKALLSLDLATGTQNKYSLMKLVREKAEALHCGQQYTLCMIDFDNFKLLNDEYGHLFGDKVLEKFSDIAHQYIQPNDVLGRYGGEEFIFIFNEMQEEQAFQQLNHIHCELAQYFSFSSEKPVTFSAGIVTVKAEDQGKLSYKDLIHKADACLYEAKQHGRSRAKSSTYEKIFTEK